VKLAVVGPALQLDLLIILISFLVDCYRHLAEVYLLIVREPLMMAVTSTSETSVNFYQIARRNIREDKTSSYSPP
jgi:hypothetical protein